MTPAHGRLATLLAATLVVLAACWVVIASAGSLPGDRAVASALADHPPAAGIEALARALAWIGRLPAALLPLVVVVAWIRRARGARCAAVALIAFLGAGITTRLLKAAVDRPRPAGAALPDGSFPSGHTSGTTALLGVAAVVAAREGRRWLAAACVVAIAAMGASRVLLGVHWCSDVLGGVALGLAWVALALLFGRPATARLRS